ncbi:hypothetical protein [Aeromicrobium sp.]|uniref:hypothetical protein n=1 Tax=Aeromicrobium sp. TaxID=1871063 RepID=UPI0019C97EDA|nr:hypothetical protein [Aeromicrobium sp.]MBC7632861.1 hypothetical protein [Aeromicrobium sp.]
MTPEQAILAATALHAGFQLVVTIVVYPALADVPADRWATAHDAHSRRILYVVVLVYAAVAGACLWVLSSGPRSPATLVAVAGSAVAAATTALVAAPLHGRLGREGRSASLVKRLLLADRVRLAATIVAGVAALLA